MVLGCAIAGTALFMSGAAHAASYGARARWRPSTDAAVTGYRLYKRTLGGSFALAVDAAMPAPGADGTVGAVLPGLDPCASIGVVVTAYRADGSESGFSNEIQLTYAMVAGSLDSDGDGLSDAAEDKNANCRVDAGETDPNRADSDGDGVGDANDLCQGTAAGAPVSPAGCACAQVSCDDGNACNGQETCTAGVCQPGGAPACDDGNACTVDACQPAVGCVHVAAAGCMTCTSAAQCDDGNPCTADTCTGGRCGHGAAADGTSCGDGRFCNGAETCRSGTCTAGPPVACDDGNVCTADACDEASRRCTHVASGECCASDVDCGVADACHTNARCSQGQCLSDPVVCSAPGPCAVAACDPQTGCETTVLADGTPCNDGNACTSNDVCRAGVCGAGASALVVAAPDTSEAGGEEEGTRLTVRPLSRGLQVVARGTLAGVPELDRTGEFAFALRDAGGDVIFDTAVPNAYFTLKPDGRAVYRDDRRRTGGGLTSIDLRPRADGMSFRLQALVPYLGAERSVAMHEVRKTAAELNVSVKSGSQCVAGSGRCKGRGQRCR